MGILKILLARYNLTMENTEYDTLALRNRDVVETFSPLANLGQDKKEENKENKEFDELELRNRTVVETLSPVEDLGQDKEESESEEEAEDEEAEEDISEEEAESEEEEKKYDELHLRKRVIQETFSPLEDLGQDAPVKMPKYDTL